MSQVPSNPKVEELRSRLKADPKNRLFYPLAEELRKIGQLAEAEQVLRTGLAHHPTYLSAWVCMGRVLRDQQKDHEAIEALSKAMQVDPSNVVAARLLGDSYLNIGEKIEAIKKYKLVQALLPADEDLKGIIERLDREINMPSVPVSVSTPEDEAWSGDDDSRQEPEAAPVAASPFESSPLPGNADDWADSSNPLGLTATVPAETRDAEPMLAAHDSSPFEEPLAQSYGSAAVEIEAPSGIQIIEAPLGAEVAAPWDDEPAPAQTAYDDEEAVSEEPLATEPPPPEDLINTITMADLYERQGLVDQAKRIYENILAKDPGNHEIRARLERHDAAAVPHVEEPVMPAPGARERKIARLQAWLDKVSGSEAGRV